MNSEGAPKIIIDTRERKSRVSRILSKRKIELKEMHLDVADYIISDRVGIERKTVGDFLNSVIDQRLFDQLSRLNKAFEKPVLILEGNPRDLYEERDVHKNAVMGALSSIAIDYGIPIIWTRNELETASFMERIAIREQTDGKREPCARPCKKLSDLPSMQEFLIAGLPNVNTALSRRLLEHFKTPREIFCATEEKLMEVNGLGREKVRGVFDTLNCEYSAKNEEEDE